MLKLFTVLLSLFLVISPALARDVVLPKLKPSAKIAIVLPRLKAISPTIVPAPQEQEPTQNIAFPAAIGKWPRTEVASAREVCSHLLKGLDMTFTALEPIGAPNGCGTVAPILISSIQGVAIKPPAEANCAFAEALYHWMTASVKPAAMQNYRKQLVGIGNASAYVCRRRNNSKTGKMSEHAIANALDISTLQFADGSTVSIKSGWGGLKPQNGFLKRIRNDACIRFSTVLGPGSDPYHGDHFHIDRAYRKSGYRICK